MPESGSHDPPLSPPRFWVERVRVDRARTKMRRAVLRRRRLLSALCAAGAVLTALRVVAPPPPATVSVLTVARDLPSGVVLESDDLVAVDFAEGTAPTGRATLDQALGRTLASPMRRGEPVTDVRLVRGSLLAGYPGMVAVPVRIPDAAAVSLLAVGDRVDILVADPRGRSTAEVSMADAPVVALPEMRGAGSESLPGALVVVGAPPDQAKSLAADAVRGFLSVTISR